MTSVLQISDTHFGTERAPVVQALAQLVDRQRPDVLLVSGDITQRATVAQFQAARAFIDRLKVPRELVIPGNHDIALFNVVERIFWPYRNFRRFFGPDLEPELDLPDLLLLTLNTTRRWRHVDGELDSSQIERVAQRLWAAAPGQLRIVVTHQPVSVSRPTDRHNLLHGHAEAIRRWGAAGADLILGGHIHLPFVRALHHAGPNLQRPLWAVQAGTALSSRVRHEAENSVNLIRFDAPTDDSRSQPDGARQVLVERWDFEPASAEFVVHEQHRLACGAVDASGSTVG